MSTMTKIERNKYGVRPGQIWEDNDKRMAGRKLRVVEVDEAFSVSGRAKCELVTSRAKGAKAVVYLKLDRFNGTTRGYSLVEEGES